jgi:peroxiredoxin
MAKLTPQPNIAQPDVQPLFKSRLLTALFGQTIATLLTRLILIAATVGTLIIITIGIFSPASNTSYSQVNTKNTQSTPVGFQVGDAAPNFTLVTLNGTKKSLSDYRGKPVVLNFWYATCPGCLAETSDLQHFYASQQKAGQDLALLGINTIDDATTARQFVQRHGLTYQIMLDTQQSVATLYALSGTPTSYFIDRQGIIRAVVIGPVDTATLQHNVTLIRS